MMQRRRFLASAGACAIAPVGTVLSPAAQAAGMRTLGSAQAFDYAQLKGRARALASTPWQAPTATPTTLAALSYDQYQAIQFRGDHALWADEALRFQVKFFHLGMFFKRPVRMFEVQGGQAQKMAQELAYDPAMFDFGQSGLAASALPPDLGFAGFRLNYHTAPRHDMVAFLGASYFRAVGGERQYGLSARGLAVDTALPRPEEFPDFTEFFIERPDPASSTLIVHALLDSPSITGAYRFAITPGDATVMDIDAALYPRTEIERLGIAPCTSMFQTGENDRRMGYDWRPEIHDSDGLSIYNGAGEWLWRPLGNPATLRFNAFADQNPRGFGLLQRDRNFEHYQDDGVFYEKRPSLWVQPKAGWGAGSVQLVEIPTVDETFDNIVAFWNPAEKPQAGQELLFSYRLTWAAEAPVQPPLARCVATRTGLGGVVGQKRTEYALRFAVDFAGGDLAMLDPSVKVETTVTASRGRIALVSARPLASVKGYRAMFDIVPGDDTSPIALRLFLRAGNQALSETWLYEWTPPLVSARVLY